MIDPNRAEALGTAIELVHFAYRAMIARPDEVLAARGLTRVHHRILYFVARSPGMSVNALLRTLGVTKQALNRPLRDLCKARLIAMDRSTDDARVKRLRLTPAGRRLEARLSALQQQHFAAAFASAGAAAEAGWRRAMAALAAPELRKSGRELPGVELPLS
ncbi:MAG TPA: MarR family transcriptional regulator [Casimicrobiaceae bacterium]|nr:MarR family transcriptional regulator [Casimicrobiaceae bacterium]